MQAGVYGYLHWTPAVFWDLSMSEYIAAMKGITAINENQTKSSNPNQLNKQDVNDLKAFLQERA